ncbi:MAG: hypothetical protein LT106_13030 [Burkholderiaceae bacterium]|nr:hypothetical protein [Burkholderiaceae bacterium]
MSTHKQALCALLFLYREVFGQELPWMQDLGRPKSLVRVSTVLSREEVALLLGAIGGTSGLIARVLYGTGIDFDRAQMQSMVPTQADSQNMTFFVSSVGPGKGGDLGRVEGDRHCGSLAQAAGAGNRTSRAYLSMQGASLSDANFVNARDRIGNGPWQNARGIVIARNVGELHSPNNNLTCETALDENGRPVKGPRRHAERARHPHRVAPRRLRVCGAPFADMTCANWTKSGTDGSAFSASDARLRSAGTSQHRGNGLLYCFAAQ